MINKEYNRFTIICDICGEESDKSFETYNEAIKNKRALHFTSQKEDGEWQDVCLDCQESW